MALNEFVSIWFNVWITCTLGFLLTLKHSSLSHGKLWGHQRLNAVNHGLKWFTTDEKYRVKNLEQRTQDDAVLHSGTMTVKNQIDFKI